jgi:hypothetical protein
VPQIYDTIVVPPNHNEYLCRWVDLKIPIKAEAGGLNPDVFPKQSDRIYGLSVNKIPPSEAADICIKITNPIFEIAWTEGQNGQCPSDTDFSIEKRNYFFLKIGDLNNIRASYPFPANAETYNCTAIIQIVPRPLVANIAHFQIEVKFDDAGASEKSRKILAGEIRQLITKNAIFELPKMDT